jgi:hypothetical protein
MVTSGVDVDLSHVYAMRGMCASWMNDDGSGSLALLLTRVNNLDVYRQKVIDAADSKSVVLTT